ncbi:MAG: NAPDH-dependent diflavin reductase [Alectoria sarmentosa]|nr:MAG: NAPDH-dependent diflavin reductase [Alectoria sarmentosa]
MQNRSALVAYGSETGNAYDYAEELGRQGDLPVNARLFWKSLLRRRLPPSYLEGAQLTTFGLGDSSYPKFNWAARKLHKRLVQLGANEAYPRGEADEQHGEGLDASFVPWSYDLRNHLLTKFPLAEGMTPISEYDLLEPKWTLTLHQNKPNVSVEELANGRDERASFIDDWPESNYETEAVKSTRVRSAATSATQCLDVTLKENRRITPSTHWQDVRHLEFSSNQLAAYAPGDVLTIFPKNISEDVDQLLQRMGWTDIADKPMNFIPTKAIIEGIFYPSPPIFLSRSSTTLRTLLTEHLDLTAIPRRSFFSLIAHFTDDQFHKDRLLEFAKPEYIDELYDYTTRPRRSILEVLQEFESVKIPWRWAANVLPELRGRQFSIASGGQLKQSPNGSARFELLVAIVKYKTVIKKIREGVCTRYLAHLPAGTKLRVGLQKGGLAITKAEAQRPIIMIGPGTGVAPMRSLVWERLQWAKEMVIHAEQNNGSINGVAGSEHSILFFGCRSQTSDYFYQDEWQYLQQRMPLTVHPAFSRDQSHKVYVQDLIQQHANSVYRLLHDGGGLVYVCGSSGNMPRAVRAALVDVFRERGAMDQKDAEGYLEVMEKEGRYKQETW